MTDLKLFRINGGRASELTSRSFALERNLQTLIEENMEVTFGVRYLASEYTTGKVHRGRIDSLGLDENGSPVIFEYKRTSHENVINQGLFFLVLAHGPQGRISDSGGLPAGCRDS